MTKVAWVEWNRSGAGEDKVRVVSESLIVQDLIGGLWILLWMKQETPGKFRGEGHFWKGIKGFCVDSVLQVRRGWDHRRTYSNNLSGRGAGSAWGRHWGRLAMLEVCRAVFLALHVINSLSPSPSQPRWLSLPTVNEAMLQSCPQFVSITTLTYLFSSQHSSLVILLVCFYFPK